MERLFAANVTHRPLCFITIIVITVFVAICEPLFLFCPSFPLGVSLMIARNARFAQQLQSRWMPDEEREACCGCQDAFTFINRRHHCRLCGKLYCGACAPPRRVVTLGDSPHRVCTACFERLRPD
jgi:hypothetical protein